MPSIEYNSWEAGISDDDYIVPQGTYIEGENVTGLATGYGITLGPKVSNQLRTNYMPRTIFESIDTTLPAVGTDNGEIFKLDGANYTPIYTLSNNWNILNGVTLGHYMYFISHDPVFTSAKVMRVLGSSFLDETFSGADENFLNFYSVETPPLVIVGDFLYIGGLEEIYRIDTSGIITTINLVNGWINGITVHGTQFLIYTNQGQLAFWDGVVTHNISALINLGFIPTRVSQRGSYDDILNDDGDYYIGSGYDVKLVSKVKSSARMNDNTQYIDKLNFTPTTKTGQAIVLARNGLFMISADITKGIYLRDYLIEGLPVGFNKEIVRDNAGNQFDEVGTLTYLTKGTNLSKLYFGYQSNTTNFGVDYIDLNTNTTCKDGYLVTPIYRGPPNKENKIEEIRITTSYTSGSNYIKLYKRINNGSWILIRTINRSTNTVYREQIQNQGDEFIDIQFKIELHNELETDFPPIVQELELIYSIIGE